MIKKFFTLIAAATLMLGMTSCLNSNDDNNNVQNLLATMYNRVVGADDSVVYSSSTYNIAIDYASGSITISPTIVVGGSNITFTSPEMKLNYNNTDNYYAFSSGAFTSSTGVTVQNLTGQFDLSNGTLYVSYFINGYRVYATVGLYYSLSTTTSYDLTNQGGLYSTTKSTYAFTIDNPTMTTSLTITNFGLTNDIAARGQLMTISGIKITPTAAGYTLSADSVTGKLNNYEYETYTFTNVRGSITDGGTSLTLTCDCKVTDESSKASEINRRMTVDGKMFGVASN